MFLWAREEKPYHLRYGKKASRLSCQASIEYWCIPTTINLYTSIIGVCKFRDVSAEKLSGLPPQGDSGC